jgi:very-short-patch-repair endonuclease
MSFIFPTLPPAMDDNFYHYRKYLKPYAQKLRNGSTKSEIRMWSQLLRAKKMKGYSFLRQRPVGPYIADFMCKKLNLIIEVDGSSHDGREEQDKERDAALAELGFTTLRFSVEEVMDDIENVEKRINDWIDIRNSDGDF